MFKQVLYEIFAGHQVTDVMLAEAVRLFSEHYGIWGEHSHNPGKHVNFSTCRLRQQILPDPSTTYYVKVTVDGKFAGNVFACRWGYANKTIWWVTQLVVHRCYRQRGLATGLLACLKSNVTSDIYGIMSSHPASIMATASTFGFTASPIPYVRDAKLRGLLFEGFDASTELVCEADTNFFVDHKEPEEILNAISGAKKWSLGKLPEGHEYLLILKGRPVISSF